MFSFILQDLNRAVLDLENLVDFSAARSNSASGSSHDENNIQEIHGGESSFFREMQANNRQSNSQPSNLISTRNRSSHSRSGKLEFLNIITMSFF
jgi:hypothetical protein